MTRSRWSVRSRLITAVLVLVALTLVIVGSVTYFLERNQIHERLETDLRISTEQFAALATDTYASRDVTSLDALLHDTLGHTVPRDNEGAVGFVGSRPAWTQPGGLDLADDQEFMDFLRERVTAMAGQDGEISRHRTAEATYIYAILPLQVGDLGQGSYVVAYDLDDEMSNLDETIRVFAIASIICLGVLALFSWILAGRLLAPVRQLTKTADQISTTDLGARLDVSDDADLGKMAVTFNSMLDRLQGAFSSQMKLLDDAGHELRTPITIIRGHLELMDAEDTAEVEQVRSLAIEELDRMHRLADDLVLLAKAKRPDFVTKKPVDVGPFIDHISDLVETLAPQRCEIEGRVEAIVDMDEQRMTQAMVQLVANASKFSPADSVIRIGAAISAGFLRLWVRDEGVGIAPEHVETIFERFGRIDPSTEGTGLGLTIVAAIAASHGGSVDVQSEVGRGTTMTLEVPMEDTWHTS